MNIPNFSSSRGGRPVRGRGAPLGKIEIDKKRKFLFKKIFKFFYYF